jgi:hypothetical protein
METVTDFCYIYGVFHNYHMLWHLIFDFIIPLFHFMKFLGRKESLGERRVYVRSDGVWVFHTLMKMFSWMPVTIISEENPMIVMKSGTIGIEKLEENPSLNRSYDDSIRFRYNFNRSTALGMREELLEALKMPTEAVGMQKKPLAIAIDRGQGGRNIQNMGAVTEMMRDQCPHCHVEVVQLQELSVENQVSLVSKASALVGLHGSGLAQVVWMHESVPNHTTHLIEILPYNYTCRDWYHTAARVAGVQYHAVMNDNPSVNSSMLHMCWSSPEMCTRLGCHDALRDQRTIVERDAFSRVWEQVAEELKYTIVTE